MANRSKSDRKAVHDAPGIAAQTLAGQIKRLRKIVTSNYLLLIKGTLYVAS